MLHQQIRDDQHLDHTWTSTRDRELHTLPGSLETGGSFAGKGDWEGSAHRAAARAVLRMAPAQAQLKPHRLDRR